MTIQLEDITRLELSNEKIVPKKPYSNGCRMTQQGALTRRCFRKPHFYQTYFAVPGYSALFELVRGYTPALLGDHSEYITPKLLEAYKDQATCRALTRLIHSQNSHLVAPESLLRGTELYFYFNTSKQNVPIEWRSGTVHSAHPFYVTIITDKGRKTKIAYEDIRLRPHTALVREQANGYMEDYINSQNVKAESSGEVQTPERD